MPMDATPSTRFMRTSTIEKDHLRLENHAVRAGLPVRHGQHVQPLQSANAMSFHRDRLLFRLISS